VDDAGAATSDAAFADSGTPDAGTPDAGPRLDAGEPSFCANADAGYWLCEDFEGAVLDAGRWSLYQQNATVTVDAHRAAAGSRSLHVHVENLLASGGYLTSLAHVPLAGQDTFVRASVFIETPLDRHAAIFKLWHQYRDGYTLEVLKQAPGVTFFETWYNFNRDPDKVQYTTELVPLGRWACWEWEVSQSDELHFWLDGVEQGQMRVSRDAGWTAPTDAALSLGWDAYHEEPNYPSGFDVWLDELVVSHQRIGCAP
jgi:hypothetical protein